ncbi:MAG: hypothetical protein JEZ00_18140 [Anaerolineaceae bacterium]|nr:hypothetical protein [Anaerolineaceae bacterium]
MKKVGVFCSNRCPGNLIFAAYDWARYEREKQHLIIVGGFHTSIEKDILSILLNGNCLMTVVLARSMHKFRMPTVWKEHATYGRLQIISPFTQPIHRITKETAEQRNETIANLVDEIIIVHASQGGKQEQQCKQWICEGKIVFAMADHENQHLFDMGCKPLN